MAELSIEESIRLFLPRVPRPVQEYVLTQLSGEVQELMQKYQLHVDQGGVLQRELLLMLLGQEEPAEMVTELRAAGIGEGTIQSLMADINEEIFKPLRQKEMAESATPPAAPTPIPTPSEPPQDRGVRTMETDMQAARPENQPPAYPQPQYQPGAHTQTYWVPVSITAVPQPYMTTEAPPQYQQPAAPQPVSPAPVEIPRTEEPTPPPPPIPAPQEREWEPPPPPNLPTAEPASIPLKKEYGADPYREPI